MFSVPPKFAGPRKAFRSHLLILLVSGLFIGFVLLTEIALGTGYPTGKGWTDEVGFVVPEGASTRQIGASLKEQGLIRSVTAFRLLAGVTGADRKLQAGEYRLDPRSSMIDILRKLKRGEVVKVFLTIPEGWTAEQIARAVEEKGLGKREKFLEAARDPRLIPEFVPRRPEILVLGEGYLFPDTYLIPRGLRERQIVELMVKRFLSVLEECRQRNAPDGGLTVHEIVTLASIIEKETGIDAERGLVSGVFYNRLKNGWRLEADPTVKYVLRDPPEYLSRKDIEIRSPYNTYLFKGLPPGPIANPGRKAMEAALSPAETDCMFFVAKGDGSHIFSRTYAEHLEAMRRAGVRTGR